MFDPPKNLQDMVGKTYCLVDQTSSDRVLLKPYRERGATHARVDRVLEGSGVTVVSFAPFKPGEAVLSSTAIALFLGTFMLSYRKVCEATAS